MAADTVTTTTSTTAAESTTLKKRITPGDSDPDDHQFVDHDDKSKGGDHHGIKGDCINEWSSASAASSTTNFLTDIVWRNVILLALLHILSVIAWITFVTDSNCKWQTSIATFLFGVFSSTFGVTAGAHRLWSHRSYKAKWPLRLILAFANTMALQNDIYEWSRDHRVHHKYSETDADPHNSKRGFFFAHMGWLMLKKHRDVKVKGQTIDLSDLWSDPIVRFQRRFYIPLVIVCWGIIPTLTPYYLWNETLWNSFLGCVCFRYVYVLHCTWLVNSAAHMWGNRPYDRNIEPRESNSVIYLSLGEGYHNYHHTFPWDYSASELGTAFNFNLTTLVIDFFERFGWAYDLKKPSNDIVKARKYRTGDRSSNLRNKYFDWIIGLLIMTSNLLITLLARFIYQNIILNLMIATTRS